MNGKNIYSGNINTTPTYVPNQRDDVRAQNQKYVATIVSENLRKNSIDLDDRNKKLDLSEKERQKVKERNDRSKDKKVSKHSDELLKMSVNYNDYDFNEWNKKIADTYNPYAIDDLSNSTLSNYEKIKRIIAQESRYEENFNKFSNNLDDIYDDIKEKITNETLKIIYGEDNFEYIPNDVNTYKENWTTGDDEADLLLKIYHSPKIKQRDISAQEYILNKYNEFSKSIDGKQPFEVVGAKTGINPNDVVRVHLDRAYYMDDISIAKNKKEQEAYTKTILERGNKSSSNVNRFGNTKPTPPRPTNRPTPPQVPSGTPTNNENAFVFNANENDESTQVSTLNRVTPRREEWISPKHNEQLVERNNAEKNWDKLKKLENPKFEDLIIENGFDIESIDYDYEINKEVVSLLSIIFDDELKESFKIKSIQKFAKKNKYELEIINNEDKTQKIIFKFNVEKPITDDIFVDNKEDDVITNTEQESLFSTSSDTSSNTPNSTQSNDLSLSNNDDNVNEEKITNLDELIKNFDGLDQENYNINNIIKNDDVNIESNNSINSNKVDNIDGVGGMARMTSSNNKLSRDDIKASSTKHTNVELVNENKVRSLAEVLEEKRNKNHEQMNRARASKKVSLQEAINLYNKEHNTDHGPRKKRLQ